MHAAASGARSCHQRYFRQMCMAVKVPSVIQQTKAALADNKCVVIGLQTTGEARVQDAVKAGADLEEFAGMKEVVKFLLGKLPTGCAPAPPAPRHSLREPSGAHARCMAPCVLGERAAALEESRCLPRCCWYARRLNPPRGVRRVGCC